MKKYLLSIYSLMFLMSTVFMTSCSNEEEIMPDNLKKEQNAMKHKAKIYTVDFGMLNDSGVSGTAELTLLGDQLTVHITASGLVPDETHPQHIHGFMDTNRNSTCPPPSADTDGDGIITIPEGAPFYGAVLLTLSPLPTADSEGNIDFTATYTIDDSITPLQNRAIVLHGLTVDGEYVATIPVACGQIKVENKGGYNGN